MRSRGYVVLVAALVAACGGSGATDSAVVGATSDSTTLDATTLDATTLDTTAGGEVSSEDPGPVDSTGWPGAGEDVSPGDAGGQPGESDAIAPDQAQPDAVDEDVTVDPLAGIPSLSPGTATFRPGGVLVTFYPGAMLETLPEGGDLELAQVIDFTSESGFRARYPKAPLAIRTRGGLHVTTPGVYRLVLLVSGAARLSVGDHVFVDVTDVTDVTSFDRKVKLDAGWYLLELDVQRDVLHPHLQLFFGADGDLLEPVGEGVLGYPAVPPADAPALDATVTLDGHGSRWARLSTTATVPASATFTWTGSASGSQTFPAFSRGQTVTIGLDAGGTYALTATFTDLWDRQVKSDAVAVTTPAIPSYTPGGLLGGYYQGGTYKSFETKVAERIDGPVNLPNSLDGNTSGSFRIDMAVDKFAIRHEGGVLIPTAGDWTLSFSADDGNRLYLDGELLADAWYDHGMTAAAATVTLPAGWHPITLEMYEQGGAGGATLEWEGPGVARTLIPADHLGAVRVDVAGAPTATIAASHALGSNAVVTVATSELSSLAILLTADGQPGIPLPDSSPTTSYRWEGQVPKGDWTVTATVKDVGGTTAVATTLLTMP